MALLAFPHLIVLEVQRRVDAKSLQTVISTGSQPPRSTGGLAVLERGPQRLVVSIKLLHLIEKKSSFLLFFLDEAVNTEILPLACFLTGIYN